MAEPILIARGENPLPITQLGVGEALVSFLDEKGTPGIVERALVLPPRSLIGPTPPENRERVIRQSPVAEVYGKVADRESAYEMLKARATPALQAPPSQKEGGGLLDPGFGRPPSGPRGGRQPDSMAGAFARSAARAMGSQVGRQIIRGVPGPIFGGGSRR